MKCLHCKYKMKSRGSYRVFKHGFGRNTRRVYYCQCCNAFIFYSPMNDMVVSAQILGTLHNKSYSIYVDYQSNLIQIFMEGTKRENLLTLYERVYHLPYSVKFNPPKIRKLIDLRAFW
jgi:hypothetical protein